MAARWYCVQLLPQLQETAKHHLKRQNFNAFFPVVQVKEGRTLRQEPLFKGYAFVKFDPEVDQWLAINGTRGVVGVLPKGKIRPEPLAEGFVEMLISGDPWSDEDFNKVIDDLFPGVDVEIKQGILQGRTGNITSLRAQLIEITLHGAAGYSTWVDKDNVTRVTG